MTLTHPGMPADGELDELRTVVRRFFAAKSSESAVRRQLEANEAWDPALWSQMARELGLQGLTIPSEYGGSDSGPHALAIVMEEAGRTLLCAPLFETVVLAVAAIRASGDAAVSAKLLPGIASGDCTASMGITAAHADPLRVPVRAKRTTDGIRLYGTERFVSFGCDVDFLLVLAADEDGSSLYLVESGANGLTRHRLEALDLTRRAARISLDGVPARLVGVVGAGPSIVTEVLRYAAVMLAAEQVGGARRILEITVDYAKTRVQFGRTIGSFQAVKHKLADLFIALTLASSVTADAVRAEHLQSGDAALAVSAASLLTGSTYVRIASQAIQVHAGIGFTWEHPAHLYLKRAKSSQLFLQDRAYHREQLLTGLLNGDSMTHER